jgi:hypothetical protein
MIVGALLVGELKLKPDLSLTVANSFLISLNNLRSSLVVSSKTLLVPALSLSKSRLAKLLSFLGIFK